MDIVVQLFGNAVIVGLALLLYKNIKEDQKETTDKIVRVEAKNTEIEGNYLSRFEKVNGNITAVNDRLSEFREETNVKLERIETKLETKLQTRTRKRSK